MIKVTKSDLYYLRCVGRRLVELRKTVGEPEAGSLGDIALADEIDWLDCFIDKHERTQPAKTTYASEMAQQHGPDLTRDR